MDTVKVSKEAVTTTGFIVIIEWDGGIPPTPYYHRLRKLTSGVRGDDEKPVIARRSANVSDEKMAGLTLQEGAIITPSETLARSIAGLARRYGAPSVHIGEVSLKNYTHMTVEDEKALDRIDEAYGRRGRPLRAHGWQVSCIECMATYFVEKASYVPNCPSCGGFVLVTYPAKRPFTYTPFPYNEEHSLLNEWLIACFGTGKFMVPMDDMTLQGYSAKGMKSSKMPKSIDNVRIVDPMEREIVDIIQGSDYTQHLVDTLPRDTVFAILNGVFASRRYYTPDHRSGKRIKAVMAIMADGYKGSIRMSEDEIQIDLLDASSVYSAGYIKGIFYSTLQQINAEK
jgi:hypothetical protein